VAGIICSPSSGIGLPNLPKYGEDHGPQVLILPAALQLREQLCELSSSTLLHNRSKYFLSCNFSTPVMCIFHNGHLLWEIFCHLENIWKCLALTNITKGSSNVPWQFFCHM
jgi:hypothetical protein